MSSTPHLHLIKKPTELTQKETLKERIKELLAKATPKRLPKRHGQGRYLRTAKHVNGYMRKGVIRRRPSRL